jgi:SPP1 gp7 family putative phage head morphogenesis protein
VRYNLASLTKRARTTRKREITLRGIKPPSTLASNLYASSYAPVIKAWEQAIPAIVAEYERGLAELTTDSAETIGSVIGGTGDELSRLVLSIRLRLSAWGLTVERWHRGKWRGAVLSATGVDIDTLVGAGDMRATIGTAIERNVDLVASVSAEAKRRISEAVFGGLSKRLPAREVAAQIREGVAMSRARALRIASNELVNISSELDRERAREAGLEAYAWVHSGKVHAREEHRARDGKRYRYGEPAGDEPGMAVNCGCTSRAVLSLDESDEF